jgi:L-ascorbate metabolism protein UlaG (beta-lactamase superfamily)
MEEALVKRRFSPGRDSAKEGIDKEKQPRPKGRRLLVLALKLAFVLAAVVFVAAGLFLRLPKFGSLPTGARLGRVQASPNYRDGAFQNLVPTPVFDPEEATAVGTLLNFLRPKKRLAPSAPIPAIKVDDLSLLPDDSLFWFGHSAFLIKLGGKAFLFDPSLGESASPVSFVNKAFKGTAIYGPQDLPEVDYLLISHDHWDHLDYQTSQHLFSQKIKIITPLGVGSHFEAWGFPAGAISEGDWWDVFEPEPGLRITLVPSRHFSGRGLKRNQSLWAGFLLEYGGKKIFYSGDGGYLPQYPEFGQRLGPVDLAIVECGQYDRQWKYIHMAPEESARLALDMGAKAAMPVHSGKYRIANHPWDEPFARFKAEAGKQSLRLVTPKIGEIVDLNDPGQTFSDWWVGID